MPTKNTQSRTELEDEFGIAPGSRGASPEGERSEAPAARPTDAPPVPGLPGGGLLDRPELSDELIDELLAGARTAEEIAGPDGLLRQLTRRLLERALQAEITEQGPVRVRSPRDRNGTFEPKIVAKRQTRWVGFDEKVIALYARGLTVREIQGHLSEIYGTDVSPDLISRITDAVLEDVKAWQNRPLEALYAVVYLDALVVKIRDGQAVRNHACYLAIGVNLDGEREVLGIWFQRSEGAKFWLQVLTELKQRGVTDVLVACVDGLEG